MSSDTLKWHVETACLNAWPAPRQVFLGGWSLRASGGPTRRANSANPLHAAAAADDTLIDKVEAFYRAQGRPAIFRIPDMADHIEPLLAARGYEANAPTRTLFAKLDDLDQLPATDAPVGAQADEAWLQMRDRLSGGAMEARQSYREIIGSILLPCGFVSVPSEGRTASLAFGVLHDDLLIIESLMTDPASRGRGFGVQAVAALLGWGRRQGVRAVALQVVADNAPALALYCRLGISRNLYGYHYRTKASG